MKTDYTKVVGHAVLGFLGVYATAIATGVDKSLAFWVSVASCATSAASAKADTKGTPE
jgi:hypothetical protein